MTAKEWPVRGPARSGREALCRRMRRVSWVPTLAGRPDTASAHRVGRNDPRKWLEQSNHHKRHRGRNPGRGCRQKAPPQQVTDHTKSASRPKVPAVCLRAPCCRRAHQRAQLRSCAGTLRREETAHTPSDRTASHDRPGAMSPDAPPWSRTPHCCVRANSMWGPEVGSYRDTRDAAAAMRLIRVKRCQMGRNAFRGAHLRAHTQAT